MQRTLLAVVTFICCAALVACSANRTATFDSYVLKRSFNQLDWAPQDYEKTGTAIVRLGDDTEVVAECPIEGLKKGDKVTVEHDEGTWVVTGRSSGSGS